MSLTKIDCWEVILDNCFKVKTSKIHVEFVSNIIYFLNHLKLVTQTDRIPASAAARHATGTTSETYNTEIP